MLSTVQHIQGSIEYPRENLGIAEKAPCDGHRKVGGDNDGVGQVEAPHHGDHRGRRRGQRRLSKNIRLV